MSIDPTAITAEEALPGQPQDVAAEEVRVQVTPEAQQAPQGQPELPEKFRGKSMEDIVKSYENLEGEHTRAKQLAKELEHRVGVYQEVFKNPQYNQPQGKTEQEIFREEWEQDPAMATYNQSQRTLQRTQALNSQTTTQMFYQNAKNDKENFPGFSELEPKMMELAQTYQGLVHPSQINSPATMHLLYKLARAENIGTDFEKAKNQGAKEAETRRKEVSKASFEGPTPASQSIDPKDMTLEQLEKELGFSQR